MGVGCCRFCSLLRYIWPTLRMSCMQLATLLAGALSQGGEIPYPISLTLVLARKILGFAFLVPNVFLSTMNKHSQHNQTREFSRKNFSALMQWLAFSNARTQTGPLHLNHPNLSFVVLLCAVVILLDLVSASISSRSGWWRSRRTTTTARTSRTAPPKSCPRRSVPCPRRRRRP